MILKNGEMDCSLLFWTNNFKGGRQIGREKRRGDY